MVGVAALCVAAPAAFGQNCRPSHSKPHINLKDMGACAFDPLSLSFSGEPVEQAMCLMRGMDATRNLAPPLERLPDA